MVEYSTAQARENLSEIINRVVYGKDIITLTRRGKPLVAVISLEELEALRKTREL